MDLVMTHHRHPIVNQSIPRVWQPWYIAGEDKATVHPVDFSSSLRSSGLNRPYEALPNRGSLRLKRRPETNVSDKSKRCLIDKLQQHGNQCADSKENLVLTSDYLSDTDDDQQLSDEDTGKLVVDDNVEEEEGRACGNDVVIKSPLTTSHVADGNETDNDGEREQQDEGGEENAEAEIGDSEGEEELVEDEQEGPLDMTTNNRNRNTDTTSAPRWSPSSSSSSPPAINMSPIFYSHPPRYNPYVSSAPPPPYHPVPQHHLASRPHSTSPPPYLPPSYASPNHFNELTPNGHRGTATSTARPAHSLQQHRPSVITCASNSKNSPPLPQQHHQRSQSSVLNSSNQAQQHHRNCLSNLVTATDSAASNGTLAAINRRTLSDPTSSRSPHISGNGGVGGGHVKSRRSSDLVRYGHRREIVSGMCDPVIDEHFRRSLGKDYPECLSTSKAQPTNCKNSSVAGSTDTSSTSSISITGMSVDDHFAKALGETWLRLQNKGIPSSSGSSVMNSGSSPASPANSIGSGYVSNSMSPKSISPSPAVQQSQQRQSIVST